jgi:hypothetical protein
LNPLHFEAQIGPISPTTRVDIYEVQSYIVTKKRGEVQMVRMVRKVLVAVAQMALLSFVEGVAEEVE